MHRNKSNKTPISTVNQKELKLRPQPLFLQPLGQSGEGEIIEMDRMRKMIADHMVHSVHTAPHVTSFVEADVTNLVCGEISIKRV